MGFTLSQWQGYFSLILIPLGLQNPGTSRNKCMQPTQKGSLWTNETDLWPGIALVKTLNQSQFPS